MTFRRVSAILLWIAVGGILAVFAGDAWYVFDHVSTFARQLSEAGRESGGIGEAILMSLGTSTVSTFLALVCGLPAAYALARGWVRHPQWIETVLDLPIVIPPLLVGISLLVLFSLPAVKQPLQWVQATWGITLNPIYTIPGIILAQFVIAGAVGVRVLQTVFERVPVRLEDAARTLGCGPWEVFRRVTLPMAWKGVVAAGILVWTRALAEFAPILMVYGSHRPNVLPVTAFLELSTGRVELAIAITLLMVGLAAVSLIVVRRLGGRGALG